MVDCMIKDPFGPDWAKYNDKLRERMWFSWGNFQEQVQILSKATTELEKKLCMDLNGVVSTTKPYYHLTWIMLTDVVARSS